MNPDIHQTVNALFLNAGRLKRPPFALTGGSLRFKVWWMHRLENIDERGSSFAPTKFAHPRVSIRINPNIRIVHWNLTHCEFLEFKRTGLLCCNIPNFGDQPLGCYRKYSAANTRSNSRETKCNSAAFLEPMRNNTQGRSEDRSTAKLNSFVSQKTTTKIQGLDSPQLQSPDTGEIANILCIAQLRK